MLKVAIAPAVFYVYVGVFDFLTYPVGNDFSFCMVFIHLFQHFIIVAQISLVSFDSGFQFYDEFTIGEVPDGYTEYVLNLTQ